MPVVLTPNLELQLLGEAQASAHVVHNSALNQLDGLVHLSIIDRDLTAPPGGESEGDCYIVDTPATGDWTGHEGDIAMFYGGGYIFVTPQEGFVAYIQDETDLMVYDGAAWGSIGGGSGAPTDAEYIVAASNGTLSAERVATTTGTISWDFGTPGQAQANVVADSISNSLIRNSGALSVIGRSANSSGDPADISASAASGAVLRESGSVLGFGTVATAGLADNCVTDGKLRDSAGFSVIGKATTGSGDPGDITAGTNTVLGRVGSASVSFSQVSSGQIANNAATDSIIRDSGALSVIGRSANSSGDPADISASAASGAVLRESGSVLGFGTVATAGLADNCVTDGKLRDGGACSVIGRSANSSGDPADISASADYQVLRRVSDTVAFAADVPIVLDRETNNQVVSSAAETTVFTHSVPAGCMGTNRRLNLVIDFTWLNQSGSNQTFTLRIKFGGSTIYEDASPSVGSNATVRPGRLDINISNLGSASSNWMCFTGFIGGTAGASIGVGDYATNAGAITISSSNGNLSVNTASAQTLEVTVQHSASNASLDFTMKSGILTLV